MTVREAYQDFLEADKVWSANLVKAFGGKAGDLRYTEKGRMIEGYQQFLEKGNIWRQLIESSRKGDQIK